MRNIARRIVTMWKRHKICSNMINDACLFASLCNIVLKKKGITKDLQFVVATKPKNGKWLSITSIEIAKFFEQ